MVEPIIEGGAMYEYEQDEAKTLDAGALHELDAWLETHEKTIEDLRQRIAPILNVYDSPTAAGNEPRPEPRSALRGRAMRLRALDESLRGILADIDL